MLNYLEFYKCKQYFQNMFLFKVCIFQSVFVYANMSCAIPPPSIKWKQATRKPCLESSLSTFFFKRSQVVELLQTLDMPETYPVMARENSGGGFDVLGDSDAEKHRQIPVQRQKPLPPRSAPAGTPVGLATETYNAPRSDRTSL